MSFLLSPWRAAYLRAVAFPTATLLVVALACGVYDDTEESASKNAAEPTAGDPSAALDQAQEELSSRRGPAILSSIELFEQLSAPDSGLDAEQQTLAWAGLAEASALAGLYSLLPPAETMPRAEQAASQALTHQPDDARTLAVQALVQYLWTWDFDAAEDAFRRASDIEPGYANTHLWWAMMLSAQGRHEEAVARVEQARLASGGSRLMETKTVTILTAAKQFEAARQQVVSVFERFAANGGTYRELGFLELATAEDAQSEELARQHYEAALEAFERAAELEGGFARSTGGLAYAAGRSGDGVRALTALEAMQERDAGEFVPPLYLALAYLGTGNRDEALRSIEKALEIRDPGLVYLRTRPGISSLSGEARYESVARAVGL